MVGGDGCGKEGWGEVGGESVRVVAGGGEEREI